MLAAYESIGAWDRNRTGTPLLRKRRILSPLCLPISPPRQSGDYRGTAAQTKLATWQKMLSGEIWRRVPESNRRRRICNPLHNHFANPPRGATRSGRLRKSGKAFTFPGIIWSGKRVSNSRPQPWQGCALPTELFPRSRHYIAIR